MKRYHFKWNEL